MYANYYNCHRDIFFGTGEQNQSDQKRIVSENDVYDFGQFHVPIETFYNIFNEMSD